MVSQWLWALFSPISLASEHGSGQPTLMLVTSEDPRLEGSWCQGKVATPHAARGFPFTSEQSEVAGMMRSWSSWHGTGENANPKTSPAAHSECQQSNELVGQPSPNPSRCTRYERRPQMCSTRLKRRNIIIKSMPTASKKRLRQERPGSKSHN